MSGKSDYFFSNAPVEVSISDGQVLVVKSEFQSELTVTRAYWSGIGIEPQSVESK